MQTYLVEWVIDLDAKSPKDAALEALSIHRDPDSRAMVFDVTGQDDGRTFRVDLDENIITEITRED